MENNNEKNSDKRSKINSWYPTSVLLNIGLIGFGFLFLITSVSYSGRIGFFLMGFFIFFQGFVNTILIIYDYLTRSKKRDFKILYVIQFHLSFLMLELALIFLISPPIIFTGSFSAGIFLLIGFFSLNCFIIYREREKRMIIQTNK